MIDVRVESKEGFDTAHEGNNFIVLNTILTEELINEGFLVFIISNLSLIILQGVPNSQFLIYAIIVLTLN